MTMTIKTIVLDVEGTTTPITFVHDKLFPFVKSNLKQYLTENWESEETQSDVALLAKQAEQDLQDPKYHNAPQIDLNAPKNQVIQQVVNNVEYNMELDRKMTALKQLQGHIWAKAYKSGAIVAEVYNDVVPQVEKWVQSGKRVYIYSSGSVLAQKMLFGHSNQTYRGSSDLTPLFSGHFDTVYPGSKLESSSYRTIAQNVQTHPKEILFVTDNIQEAYAAREAGWNVILSIRPGTAPLPSNHPFKTVTSFDQITL